MYIFSKNIYLIIISFSLNNDISKQTLLNNSINQILDIIKNNTSYDELNQTHFDNCKNIIKSMDYNQLYELFDNSGKHYSDIGNFWDCSARNLSYYIISNHIDIINTKDKAILYLKKSYLDFGLCVPIECNIIVYDFVNSKYYKNNYLITNASIFSYISSNNKEKRENKYKLEKKEIISMIIFVIIIILLFIKILTPIIFGTCLYKYSYLKSSKTNYIPIIDSLTDDDEEINDENDDNDSVQLFRNIKLNEMKKEEEENIKNTSLKSSIFKKHIQSFFSININLDLLISNKNFLYNNNLLQPISFFKSITLFLLFYNESFFALTDLPIKNVTNEKFYYRYPMMWVKFSTFFIDVYIALEGFLFAYKLFNYIVKHHNNKNFGYTLLFFYTKTIPKMVACFCSIFLFNIGIKVVVKRFDLSPFVEYIRIKQQKKCILNLSYIFVPFKLQYSSNNFCLERLFDVCYKYIYINLNIQLSITFSLFIIYLVFKFKDELFDKLILLLFLLNTIFSPLSCHHDLGKKFNTEILSGETCSIKYTHLFLNKFFFGMLIGIIYFYHNDIISQTPLGKIYFKDQFIPFSYCLKLMEFLDKTSPGLKIIYVVLSIGMLFLLSSIFIFYEKSKENIIFSTSGFDWILIDNYEKKLFILFFMFMLINLLFINKVSNFMIYKWLMFNLISRTSFSMFCTMHMLIYFIYSNYYIKIYLNFHNILFMAISHFVICLFINVIFTILIEQSFKIICKNTFGELQNKFDITTGDLEAIVKSNFHKKNKINENSSGDLLELYKNIN